MFHRTTLVLVLAPFFAAVSCRRDESSGTSSAGTPSVSLEVFEPLSGGSMLLVPAGEFTMGQEGGVAAEKPHVVKVRSFYMDRYLVTQEIYEKIIGANPSRRRGAKLPVSGVYWTQAVRFCNKCSEMEGLTPCYDLERWTCNLDANGYRLPTEAEWEYACRAGTATKYFFGDSPRDLPKYAWSKPRSLGRTHPVGERLPNPWGLYDMLGNVWEWCNDWYGETYYHDSPREDPPGPPSGKMRVLRGGAWNSPPERCRSAYRAREFPVFQDACFGVDGYGFRRVRNAGAGRPKVPPASPAAGAGNAPPPEERPAPAAAPPARAPAVQGPGKIDPARLKGTIVFVSDRSGHLDIWKMDAAGRSPKALTHDEHPDADPRFSPDGRKILYTTLRGGFPRIWLMNRDGSAAAKVADGAQGAWSPDGRSIVFVRDDQAWIRDLASGHETRITPASWVRCGTPAWSPDGKRIAVASRHEREIGVYLLDPDGGHPARLVTEQGCCTPDWSPASKRLVVQTVRGHIHEIGADGKGEEPLTFGADVQHEARYSPDGALLVFCRAPAMQGPWQIYILDLESDDLDFVQITREGSNRQPDWGKEP